MTIKAGDALPSATVVSMTADGPSQIDIRDLLAGKKAVLFGVPGAFTPTCHNKHLPGFVANADALKAKGVDLIACVSVNDIFVLDAWAVQSGATGQVTFLADGNGEFTRNIGMEHDLAIAGMGVRSKRYAMVVDDNTVTNVFEDNERGVVSHSGAEHILSIL